MRKMNDENGKDPAFLFYSSDFLTGTAHMTDEEVGIYTRLIALQHQKGGLIEKNIFNRMLKNKEFVNEKFIETEDGYFNERLMKEMVRREKKSISLSLNAKKRWDEYRERMQMECKCNANAYARHMPSVNENVNENEYVIDNVISNKEQPIDTVKPIPGDNGNRDELFKQFWQAYPKKQGKGAALKAWDKIKPDQELLNTMLDTIDKFKQTDQWTKDGGKFIPLPATWLNGQRWLDEVIETKKEENYKPTYAWREPNEA